MGTPVSAGEKAAVLAQLERIVGSAAFRNSKRYPSLLRHVVERTLAGSTSDLKERTLGVEVFGRPADYDTNSDPIVRVTAGEVRNRIARYYHEPGREAEIRIDLPAGSYVPEFQFPTSIPAQTVVDPEPVRRTQSRSLLWSLLPAALLVVALALWRPWTHSRSYERFWGPFLSGGTPVTICLARSPRSVSTDDRSTDIGWPDVSTAVKMASLVAREGGRYQLRRDDTISFEDLRQGPAILIGAFNDVWTLRLSENLRFEPRQEGNLRWILDRKNPGSRAWSVEVYDRGAPTSPSRDYAIISRLLMARSGKPALTIAGLRGYGTEIAGELATDRSFPETVGRNAPAGWETKNVQVVVETEVIDNHSGPARILAVHVW